MSIEDTIPDNVRSRFSVFYAIFVFANLFFRVKHCHWLEEKHVIAGLFTKLAHTGIIFTIYKSRLGGDKKNRIFAA